MKDEVVAAFDKLINEKEYIIVERTATVTGLGQKVKTLSAEKVTLTKKVELTDKLKGDINTKDKEIAALKVQLDTKNKLLAMAKGTNEQDNTTEEIVLEAMIKRCKKCQFTAPNMTVIGLHMENDHQYEFECAECTKKFPFKNQLKLHRRETHEEGTFACFVCNEKFKTHKQLKAHIQRKCKNDNPHQPRNTCVHRQNEDILPEDEHKCPKCPKITNNQVSLMNHMNTVHMNKKEICDTCGQNFSKREDLVKHIVDNHTNIGIHQQQQLQGSGRTQQHGGPQGVVQGGPRGGPQGGPGLLQGGPGLLQGGPQGALQGGPQGGLQGWPLGHPQGGVQGELLPRFKCHDCRYVTNSQNELEYHKETVHQQTSSYCYRCKTKMDKNNTIENHMCRLPGDDSDNTCNFCHKQFYSTEEKRKHICQHHRFKTVEQQRREKKRANTECTNGADCWRAKRNMCWFLHSQPLNISSHLVQGQGQSEGGASSQLYCRYQERCFKGVQSYRYKHFNQGFPQNNVSQISQ